MSGNPRRTNGDPRRLCAVWVLAFIIAVPAWSAAQAGTDYYVIGPHDVLVITLWDQPDLSGRYPVNEQGVLTFPLVGSIQAGGLTLRKAEDALKKRLAGDGYFKDPKVTIAVEEYKSQRVFLVGEVKQPGTYPLTGQMTVIEILARAGSTTPQAKGDVIIIRRKSSVAVPSPAAHAGTNGRETGGHAEGHNDAEVIRVDLGELQAGALARNVTLTDGDTIFVPRAESVFVVGQVRSPGAYTIQKGMTLLQVLSLAGGLTDRGAAGRIKVLRVSGGQKKEIKIRPEDPVEPGDTIVVPERFF
jgi:polysaccharide biosynthesis/export protein